MSFVVFLIVTSCPAVYSGVVTTEDRYPEVSDSPPSSSSPALKSLTANEHREFTYSCDKAVAEDSSAAAGRIDVYPALTTGLPPTRDEHAGNPMLFYAYAEGNRDRPQGTAALVDGHRWEHSANGFENAPRVLPKRNGYNNRGYRRLKKQRVPVVVEMDLEDIRDSAVAADEDAEDYYEDDQRPGGGGAADHGHVAANGRRPGAAADANDRLLAAKIASAKLKTAGALKVLALLAAKLKLLVLLKLHLFAKLYVLVNAAKLLSPLLLRLAGGGILAILANLLAVLSAPNVAIGGVNGVNGINGIGGINGIQGLIAGVPGATVIGSRRNGRARENGTVVAGGFRCVERAACRLVGRLGSASAAFANRILSYPVDYVTNEKLKSSASTLKRVSDYRLKNIFRTPSTKEWLKWCEEHYPCGKKK